MKKSRIVRIALLMLLGIIVAFQYRIILTGQKYMSIKDMYSYSIELESHRMEVEQLKQKRQQLQNQIDAYRTAKEDETIDYEAFLNSEIESTKAAAGLTALEGPGVVILVSDGTRELGLNENRNRLLVHDLDIRAVVDELRNAGAEAISINGERVVFNKSNIQCTGPTIKVNDQVFAPPYIIQAIGDSEFLESAMNAPGSFTADLTTWGLFVEVDTSVSISIPAYTGFTDYEYLN